MNMKIKDGGPAFGSGNPTHGGYPGMSLRDWFARQALAGNLRAGECPDAAAQYAYIVADAMLAEREARDD